MLSRALAGEDGHVLRHDGDALRARPRDRPRAGRRRRRGPRPSRDRRSAGSAKRPCSCPRPRDRRSPPSRRASPRSSARGRRHGPAAPDRRRTRRRNSIAPAPGGSGVGIGRRRDGRLFGQDLGQPLGRTRRLAQFAPHFRQRAERAGGEHRIEQELAERARRQTCLPARRASRTTAPPRRRRRS